MSNPDVRDSQRTQANDLVITDPAGIDAAIEQLEERLTKLRQARELVLARERLRADLAKLDQDIEGVIKSEPSRHEPTPPAVGGELHATGSHAEDEGALPGAPAAPLPPAISILPPSVKTRVGRHAMMLTHAGRTLSIYAWAKETGIKVEALRYRIKAGWTPEMVLGGAPYARGRKVDNVASPSRVEPDGIEIDIDARAAGLTSGPGLQQQLDQLEGKPVVLPAGMPFTFDPKATAASVPMLKAETILRQRGGKSRTVEFITTASRNHVHVAVLDHFGDGQTKPDSTGHVHRFARWKAIEAHRHEHGLTMTARAS